MTPGITTIPSCSLLTIFMFTTNDPKLPKLSQPVMPELSDRQHGKIIDFFSARRILYEEAKAKDLGADLEEAVRLMADRNLQRINLPDPFTDALLLLSLAAAVLLGLLVISGFG